MDKTIKTMLIKIVTIIYSDFVYPHAKNYVESTSNQYDDMALTFLDDFVKDLLAKL